MQAQLKKFLEEINYPKYALNPIFINGNLVVNFNKNNKVYTLLFNFFDFLKVNDLETLQQQIELYVKKTNINFEYSIKVNQSELDNFTYQFYFDYLCKKKYSQFSNLKYSSFDDKQIIYNIEENFVFNQEISLKLKNDLKKLGIEKEIIFNFIKIDHEKNYQKIDDEFEKKLEEKSQKFKTQFNNTEQVFHGRIFDIVLEARFAKIKPSIKIVIDEPFMTYTAYFDDSKKFNKEFLSKLKLNAYVKIIGIIKDSKSFEKFVNPDYNDLECIDVKQLEFLPDLIEKEIYEKNRVELHLHSKMSAMDAVTSIEDYITLADKLGHNALAITDHNVLQAYPEAQSSVKKINERRSKDNQFKMIYGVELNLIDNFIKHVNNPQDYDLQNCDYIIFDIETTGLYSRINEIIQFAGARYRNDIEIERIDFYVKPKNKIPKHITEITKITNDIVENEGIELEEALIKIKEWTKNAILVAHNAEFDLGFLNEKFANNNMEIFKNPTIDTLTLSRYLLPNLKYFRLENLAKNFDIPYGNGAHRADYDTEVLAKVFINLKAMLLERSILKDHQINSLQEENNYKKIRPFHISVLAKNELGLKSIFELVTLANTKYEASIVLTRQDLIKLRQNLLIGSACANNEIFNFALNKSKIELQEAMKFYDYIEIQPPSNYSYLINNKYITQKQIEELIIYIYQTAKEINKLVVATGNVHYLNTNQKKFRDIYINTKAVGGGLHPLNQRTILYQNPDQHYRSTKEMLECFAFLEKEIAEEIVITNTNIIAEQIEHIYPIKSKLYPPIIKGDEEELKKLVYNNAYSIYGNPLPEIVEKRLEKEFKSIIENKFSVIYSISAKLVKKSLDDGYLVGSRGSVGSSLVATLAKITEVNPLPPHYICANCKYCEFVDESEYASGFDLEIIECPQCQNPLKGEGHNIPFETFLGIKGDKVPDIDLNFSGDYQSKIHNYAREIFGENNVFRAGTISTVAEKTAYGYVRGYLDQLDLKQRIKSSTITYLSKGCEGVKRTTGQHPGGIIIIPDYQYVYDFTAVQYPADDNSSDWKTTHFDFHAIHDNLLKLDLLGHDDPTAIKMLCDLSGVDINDVEINDSKVISIFNSLDALGEDVKKEFAKIEPKFKNGASGLPEFGTNFVKRMLDDTKPKNFSQLVQISGLSHGTDVWANNAQELVKDGKSLSEVIGCRDDIMVKMMQSGIDMLTSFKIMEDVRKGKGLTSDFEKIMKENNIEQWYINSCNRIKYMFPKAHAVAYVMMAVRVAWFKVYYPLEYYATYFSIRSREFDVENMIKGKENIRQKLISLREKIKDRSIKLTNKEINLEIAYEIAYEMHLRGITFLNIDLANSQASNFKIDYNKKGLYIPFIAIDGLGENVANSIIEARIQQDFISKQDFAKRSQINTTSLSKLEELEVFKFINDSNQLSFDFNL